VDTGTLLATLLGGGLAILGGIVATLLLAWLERRRERQRRRERHAVAVRLVAQELQGNGVALVNRAQGGEARASSALHDSVAVDFYGQLPVALASDVGFAYHLTSAYDIHGQAAAVAVESVTRTYKALREYGERELGLKFAMVGEGTTRHLQT
jgi:hypothetical protein